jgi:type VI secretion system protein ImpL
MRKLLRLLFHPMLLGITGVAALCLLIWYVGPLIAIANYRPLDSTFVRGVLIALAIAIYVARQAWKLWKARSVNRKLLDGLLAAPASDKAAPSASAEEAATLRQRFEEAVDVLRKLRVSSAGRKPGLTDLFALSGRQYLYQLPWYVFIGAPGSGKTTALINSGLQFPLAERFGTQSLRGVGGTRNCDWWFTDEAVLLDTAGRYATQESDRATDSAAWSNFLQLLKKFRPRRPINGILLTLSVSDLLRQSAAERDAHAKALRARIQELHEQFGIRFPIYVLVTKCDLLAGFTEFFGELGKEERTQVWGITFPYRGDEDRTAPLSAFDAEFTALEQRLLDHLTERLQEERDVERRPLIFGFPQQLGMLKPVLGDILTKIFEISKFEESVMLRGVYFTSGTQEGSPIDRVMGQISRAFGVGGRTLPPLASSGRSYFLTRLLRDVVFAEHGLAGANLRWERRRTVLRWVAYSALALSAVVLLAGWAMSYARNSGYIAAVQERVPPAEQDVAALPPINREELLSLLPVLGRVRDVAITPEIASGVPRSMQLGLFQGEKLSAAAQLAYRRLLRDAVLPRIAQRLETQLRAASGQNLEYAYLALKAYLMLYEPANFDAESLKAWILVDWDQNLAQVTTDQRAELEVHLDSLLDQGALDSPLPINQELVLSTRAILARYSLPQRVYSTLRRVGVGEEYPAFSISRIAGPNAALAFERASRKPLDPGVPGLFSFDAYHKAVRKQAQELAEQMRKEESWVMGTAAPGALETLPGQANAQLTEDVLRLYMEDYARTWEAFLADVRLRSTSDLQTTLQVTRVLSAPDSPLPPFLRAVVRETTLGVKQVEEKSLIDKAGDKLTRSQKDLAKLIGATAPAAPAAGAQTLESIVDDRFANLRSMVTSAVEGQPPPINQTLLLINDVYLLLNATQTALNGNMQPPQSPVPNQVKAEAARMPEPLRSLLQDLSTASAQQTLSAVRGNLSAGVLSSIGSFCRQAITGRYPFARGATQDVTRDDFARLFAPGGSFDSFFNQTLAQLVDTSTRPWSFRRVNDVSMGETGNLIQFQRAATIRDVFFRAGGNTPGLRLEFKPVEMDAAISQFTLDVDGQLVKYSHGPQFAQAVQWPGPRGGNQVHAQITPPPADGPSGITAEGAWSLFRLFDKVLVEPSPQPERFRATFNLGNRKTVFEVTASSVQNPFRLRDLEQFQCPGGL